MKRISVGWVEIRIVSGRLNLGKLISPDRRRTSLISANPVSISETQPVPTERSFTINIAAKILFLWMTIRRFASSAPPTDKKAVTRRHLELFLYVLFVPTSIENSLRNKEVKE